MSSGARASTGHTTVCNFFLIGELGPNDPRSPWVSDYDTQSDADHAAQAWAVAGWSTRVVDLRYQGSPNIAQGNAPAITTQYPNLLAVTDVNPGVTQYCMQMKPMEPILGMSDSDFAVWLVNFAAGTPTYVPAGGTTTSTTSTTTTTTTTST